MSDKSFVTLAAAICPVCGQKHQTGELLLDQRMRSVFERETVTGWQMCEEHQKMADDGYIALIEVSNRPTKLEDAYRTGQIAHIRRTVWGNVFGGFAAPEGPIAFVEVGTIAQLRAMTGESDEQV